MINDDEDNDDLQIIRKSSRKSKIKCAELLQNSFNDKNSDSDENDNESEYDSMEDPEFNDTNEEYDEESADVISVSEDESCSNLSDLTELNDTLNMIRDPSFSFGVSEVTNQEFSSKPLKTKKKTNDNISRLVQLARTYLWKGQYDKASEICETIRKEDPQNPIYYKIMADICQETDDVNLRNLNLYYSCLFERGNNDNWMKCVKCYEETDGIDKAIDIAKQGLLHVANRCQLREYLADLLHRNGDEHKGLAQRLLVIENYYNHDSSQLSEDELQYNREELFYLMEKFESIGDSKRSTTCMLVLCTRYPGSLSQSQIIELVLSLMKYNRFKRVVTVVKYVEGVKIKTTNYTDNTELCLYFAEDVPHRLELIFGVLTSVVMNELVVIMNCSSFSEYLHQLTGDFSIYLKILYTMFAYKYYKAVIIYVDVVFDQFTEYKANLMKLKGQSLEKIGFQQTALDLYDDYLSNVNDRDGELLLLKIQLLYEMNRTEEAEDLMKQSSESIRLSQLSSKSTGVVVDWDNPGHAVKVIFALVTHYDNNVSGHDFIKALWHYLFLDVVSFLKQHKYQNHLQSCAELDNLLINPYENNLPDIDESALTDPQSIELDNLVRLQNRLSNLYTAGFENIKYKFCLSTASSDQNWNCFNKMYRVLVDFIQLKTVTTIKPLLRVNLALAIEVLCQWGYYLSRILYWDKPRRLFISEALLSAAVYVRQSCGSICNRLEDKMLHLELHRFCEIYSEHSEIWNFYNYVSHLTGTYNQRFVLRFLTKTKNNDCLHIMNVSSNIRVANSFTIGINYKMYQKHAENTQMLLQMAIVLQKASISRRCNDVLVFSTLARTFLMLYVEKRGLCQETLLNQGIFCQRYNNIKEAAEFYKRCCEMEPTRDINATNPSGDQNDTTNKYDLSRHAAYALSQISKQFNTHQYQSTIKKYLKL